MADLRDTYKSRHQNVLKPLASRLRQELEEIFENEPRIDRIAVRAKAVDRFLSKADKRAPDGSPKYASPLDEIQDQVGAMIVTFYLSDVERVVKIIRSHFREIEEQSIAPESSDAFNYVGRHLILYFPTEVTNAVTTLDGRPKFFELQIKTLFQHAWAQANHDLGYKPTGQLLEHEKRQMAFTAAQAWGADWIFDEIFRKQAGENGDKP